MSKSVVDRLRSLANLFQSRNTEYGDAYHKFGPVLRAFFPDGVTLRSDADFARFALFMQAAGKLHRYALNFSKGGHVDSLDDNSVYSQMLQEYDEALKERTAAG